MTCWGPVDRAFAWRTQSSGFRPQHPEDQKPGVQSRPVIQHWGAEEEDQGSGSAEVLGWSAVWDPLGTLGAGEEGVIGGR